MSIFVRKIQCLEDTDEFGSDGIYLVVFRGKTKPPFLSALGVHGPGVDWDDFSPGTVWDPVVKKKIFKTTSPDQVYAVVMVERDFGTDVSGEVLDHWQDVTATAWSSIMGTLGAGGTTSVPVGAEHGSRELQGHLPPHVKHARAPARQRDASHLLTTRNRPSGSRAL